MKHSTTTQRKRRKRRDGEFTCTLGCYHFPHRFGGGACDGSAYVENYFCFGSGRECADCHLRDELTTDYGYEVVCQVLQGLEPPDKCPALQEFLLYEGVVMNRHNCHKLRRDKK